MVREHNSVCANIRCCQQVRQHALLDAFACACVFACCTAPTRARIVHPLLRLQQDMATHRGTAHAAGLARIIFCLFHLYSQPACQHGVHICMPAQALHLLRSADPSLAVPTPAPAALLPWPSCTSMPLATITWLVAPSTRSPDKEVISRACALGSCLHQLPHRRGRLPDGLPGVHACAWRRCALIKMTQWSRAGLTVRVVRRRPTGASCRACLAGKLGRQHQRDSLDRAAHCSCRRGCHDRASCAAFKASCLCAGADVPCTLSCGRMLPRTTGICAG